MSKGLNTFLLDFCKKYIGLNLIIFKVQISCNIFDNKDGLVFKRKRIFHSVEAAIADAIASFN